MRMTLLAAFTAAHLSGCTSPPQSLLDPRDPIPVQPIASEVALAPGIENRIEPVLMFDTPRHPWMTGEAWRASFPVGDGKQRATLHLESTTLRHELTAAGFASRYSYTVKAALDEGNKSTPLSAEGYQHSAMQYPTTPIRMAFIMAIESLAKQAAAALSPRSTNAAPTASAAQRLRDLEALWRDKLITENEYRARRQALLQEL